MPAEISSHFPFPEFRTLQRETLEEIGRKLGPESKIKYLFLEAPTGSGKSPLAIALARHLGGQAMILTPQKVLQDQYCVAPETRVITADLRWVCAGDLSVGEELLAFSEYRSPNRRIWRRSIVEAIGEIVRPCYRLTFDDGIVVTCSSEHQWLGGAGQMNKWISTRDLQAGTREERKSHRGTRCPTKIVRILDTWEVQRDRDAGYLAAAFDGEGHLHQRGPIVGKVLADVNLSFAQNNNEMLAEVMALLRKKGFQFNGSFSQKCKTICISKRAEVIRFLGQLRPVRLLPKFDPDRIGMIGPVRRSAVLMKQFVGDQTVVALRTSTGTFVAEGLASHNCNSFPGLLADLRGRSTYDCNREGVAEFAKALGLNRISASEAPCKAAGKSWFDECRDECPYFSAIDRAEASPIALLNTAAFLYQTNHAGRFRDTRDLIVVDEAHNLEGELLRFLSWQVSDRGMPFRLTQVIGDRAPDLLAFLAQAGFEQIAEGRRKQALAKGEATEINRWDDALRRFKFLQWEVPREAFVPEKIEEHTRKGESWRSIEIRPICVNRWAGKLIFDRADRFLLMSATILDPQMLAEFLGLPYEECGYIRVPSTFPKERRPIHVIPSGSMGYETRATSLPGLVAALERVSAHHASHRGLVHCHSFWLGEEIRKRAGRELKKRLIWQRDLVNGDPRATALQALRASRNGVLMGPAFHEGLDLVDDLSRFQVIAKVPYPDLTASRQLAARVKGNWRYYLWLTALKLVQSTGRSVRSGTDWAHTYILDSDFLKFFGQARSMMPPWFVEALHFTGGK